MEYSLRLYLTDGNGNEVVLILILMEYSLRHTFANQFPAMKIGLNPYSNGI